MLCSYFCRSCAGLWEVYSLDWCELRTSFSPCLIASSSCSAHISPKQSWERLDLQKSKKEFRLFPGSEFSQTDFWFRKWAAWINNPLRTSNFRHCTLILNTLFKKSFQLLVTSAWSLTGFPFPLWMFRTLQELTSD